MSALQRQLAKLEIKIFDELDTGFDPGNIKDTSKALSKIGITTTGTTSDLMKIKDRCRVVGWILKHRRLSKQEDKET